MYFHDYELSFAPRIVFRSVHGNDRKNNEKDRSETGLENEIGKPKKKWIYVVGEDMRACGIDEKMDRDKECWREKTRVADTAQIKL